MMEKIEAVGQLEKQHAKPVKRHSLRFLKAFIKNPGSVGAIVPSAPELAKAMVKDLRIEAGNSIIELGPGTGAFTLAIRELLPDTSSYLGIEREEEFVQLLENRFPDMPFVSASAEDAFILHENAGLGPVKVVISSLPFATLPALVRHNIIDSIEQLMAPGCIFRTFQYVHSFPLPSAIKFRRNMAARFGPCHKSAAILPNVPPAYVLTWEID